MGVGPDRDASTVDPGAFFDDFALENRPVEPDFAYGTSLEDIRLENLGWRRAVDSGFDLSRKTTSDESSASAPGRP